MHVSRRRCCAAWKSQIRERPHPPQPPAARGQARAHCAADCHSRSSDAASVVLWAAKVGGRRRADHPDRMALLVLGVAPPRASGGAVAGEAAVAAAAEKPRLVSHCGGLQRARLAAAVAAKDRVVSRGAAAPRNAAAAPPPDGEVLSPRRGGDTSSRLARAGVKRQCAASAVSPQQGRGSLLLGAKGRRRLDVSKIRTCPRTCPSRGRGVEGRGAGSAPTPRRAQPRRPRCLQQRRSGVWACR